jgi:hypothetical protein
MMMRGCEPLLSVRICLLLGLWRMVSGRSGRSGRCRASCRIHERSVLERLAIASAAATSRRWEGSPSIVVLVVPAIRRCRVVRMVVLRVMGGWLWLLLLFVAVDCAGESGNPGLEFGFVGHARCL